MERLFGAIPTERHTAPTASLSASPIEEEERAGRFLARLYREKVMESGQAGGKMVVVV